MDIPSFISSIAALPTPPAVLETIAAAAENRETPDDAFVKAVRFDPAVAGRILRAANTNPGNFPHRISSIANAVAFLGRDRASRLALLSRSLSGNRLPELPPFFTLENFWRHAVLVALFAESIGRHVQRYTPLDEQELFSAGLLHDVGKLAIAAGSAGTLESVRLRSVAGSLPFFSAEAEAPHATIGAMLAEQWHLPPELRRAIGGHHTPSGGAAAIVNVADVMAHLVGYPIFSGEVLPPVDETALAAIPLPPERLKIIAEDGLDELFALECAFGIAGPMATAG